MSDENLGSEVDSEDSCSEDDEYMMYSSGKSGRQLLRHLKRKWEASRGARSKRSWFDRSLGFAFGLMLGIALSFLFAVGPLFPWVAFVRDLVWAVWYLLQSRTTPIGRHQYPVRCNLGFSLPAVLFLALSFWLAACKSTFRGFD